MKLSLAEIDDYVAGKANWLAHGLATAGTQAGMLRARHALRDDVVTAAPDEPIGEAHTRVIASPYGCALVVAADDILVGRLRAAALAGDPAAHAEQVMEAGSTCSAPASGSRSGAAACPRPDELTSWMSGGGLVGDGQQWLAPLAAGGVNRHAHQQCPQRLHGLAGKGREGRGVRTVPGAGEPAANRGMT